MLPRINFRLTPDDAQAVSIICTSLQASGRQFVNKTEVIRTALAVAADHLAKSPERPSQQ